MDKIAYETVFAIFAFWVVLVLAFVSCLSTKNVFLTLKLQIATHTIVLHLLWCTYKFIKNLDDIHVSNKKEKFTLWLQPEKCSWKPSEHKTHYSNLLHWWVPIVLCLLVFARKVVTNHMNFDLLKRRKWWCTASKLCQRLGKGNGSAT